MAGVRIVSHDTLHIYQTNGMQILELEKTLFFAALNSFIEHFIEPVLIFEARI
jgi:hypothetical protein